MPTIRLNTKRTLLSTLLLLACALPTSADDFDATYLRGLRDRHLYTLAASLCREQQGRELSPKQQSFYATELVRTYAQQAINTPPQRQPALWKAADEAVANFTSKHPRHPRRVLVEMQGALVRLARGELARQSAELAGGRDADYATSRTVLAATITQLSDLEKQAAVLQRSAPVTPGADGTLGEGEIYSLQQNIRYQTARAYRNLGQAYPPGSDDRIHAMLQAIDLLQKLSLLPADDPLMWPSRIDEVNCLRLREQFVEASKKLEAFSAVQPPVDIRLRARAAAIELALDSGQLPHAQAILIKGTSIAGQNAPQLDEAILKAHLAFWKASQREKNTANAKQHLANALATVQMIESHGQPYWTRRAAMLLSSTASSGDGSSNVVVLVHTAKTQYLRKEFDAAVASYSRAGEAALKSGANNQAYDLFYNAATIEYQRDNLPAALARYHLLADTLKTHPKSAQAHLLATVCAAKLARDGKAESLANYGQLLTEHIDHWPNAASADKARIWLGKLYEFQRNWGEAARIYEKVSTQDPTLFDKAVRAADRCWQQHLNQLASENKPLYADATGAAGYFEKVAHGPDGQAPERFSKLAQFASLTAARIRLNFTGDGFKEAEKLLQDAIAGSPDAEKDWLEEAQALLVVALAGQGRAQEAVGALQQVSGNSPQVLLQTVSRLSEIAASSTPQARKQLAKVQQLAIGLLRPQATRLSSAERQQLDRVEAEALVANGHISKAITIFTKLTTANPNDGAISERFGELLLSAKDKPTLTKALDQWRQILRKSRPDTARWYRAKYNIALAHYKLGNKTEAAKMIRFLQALKPGLGGPKLKPKFEELLRLSS